MKNQTTNLSDRRSFFSAGDTMTQLSKEVEACSPEERAKLLEVISSRISESPFQPLKCTYLSLMTMAFWFWLLRGAGCMHPYFNNLVRTYNSVKQPAQKLLLMLKEHMLHVTPINVAARPEVKHYKKKSKQL